MFSPIVPLLSGFPVDIKSQRKSSPFYKLCLVLGGISISTLPIISHLGVQQGTELRGRNPQLRVLLALS